MKISLFFTLMLSINFFVYSQFDFSSGVSWRASNESYDFSPLYYFIKLDVPKKGWVWNNELSFSKSKIIESSSNVSHQYGGGSGAAFSSYTSFNSKLRYTPLVLREGFDLSFDRKCLLFIKASASMRDIALEAKEYDNYLISVEGNNSNVNHQYVETKRDTIFDFNSIKTVSPYFLLGLKCSRHIYYKRFFFSWQLGAGVFLGTRFHSNFDSKSFLYDAHSIVDQNELPLKPFLEMAL